MLNILKIYNSQITFIVADNQGNILSQSEQELIYTSYSEIESIFPDNFQPDIIYFLFPEYYFIPIGLENCQAITFALVSDWNLNFIQLKDTVKIFDYIFTDKKGVKTFNDHSFDNVEYFPLFPLQVFDYEAFNKLEKKYDICFIGNLNNNIQVERAKYLYNLAKLADKYNVIIQSNIYGDEYKKLISQSKITFNLSIRGELNIRVFESINARSLLLLEEDNLEADIFFKDSIHFVAYNQNNLFEKIDFYLKNDPKREEIISNAYQFALEKNQNYFQTQLLKKMIDLRILNVKKRIILNANTQNYNYLKGALTHVSEIPYKFISAKVNLSLDIKSPDYINLFLINQYNQGKNLKDLHHEFIYYMKIFPKYIPLKINWLKISYISSLPDFYHLIKTNIDQLMEEILNNQFSLEDLAGYIIDVKYSRFSVEYEKAYALKDIELLKTSLLYLLYILSASIIMDQDLKLGYLNKADKLYDSPDLKLSIGNIYEEKTEYNKAYNYYHQSLRLNPFNFSTIYLLDRMSGILNIKAEDQEWLTIIDASPIFSEVKNNLIDYQKKNFNHKIALLKKYLSNQSDKKIISHLINKIADYIPDNNDHLLFLANIFYDLENYKKALDLLVKFIQVTGQKNKSTIAMISNCLKYLGDTKTSEKLNSK